MLNEPLKGDRTRLEPRRAVDPLIAGLLMLVFVGIGGFVIWRRGHAPQMTPPALVHTAPAMSANALSPSEQIEQRAAEKLSSAGVAADGSVRTTLGALSPRAQWQAWLNATRDLIESCAVIIANFSDDEDPRRRLRALEPTAPFEVIQDMGRTVESPLSKHRFDGSTEVLNSIDVDALAPIWRSLHPLIAVAYRSVGRPGVSLDQAASHALARIENAPVQAGEPVLEKAGKFWIYSDPSVESQGQLEKLLFRMGPENERMLQAKATSIRTALALP